MKRKFIYSAQHIENIERVSNDLSSLATLLRWAGNAAAQTIGSPSEADFSALGCAVSWAGHQIEQRCAIINDMAADR